MLQTIPKSDQYLKSLDLLSGKGETWKHIRRRFPKAEITAIDFSERMTQLARNKNKSDFNGCINVFLQDVLCTELPDEYYDVITCAFGLKSFTCDQLTSLASLTHRILKPGGHIAFIESSRPRNPLLRPIHSAYIRYLVPALGRLLGNKEFNMLWLYTKGYNNSKQAASIFKNTGLTITYDQYFFGCATGFHGRKE